MNVPLLLAVKEAILAEPLRINMDGWVFDSNDQIREGQVPPCGTVACIAGWAFSIINRLDKDALYEQFNSDTAAEMLDVSNEYPAREAQRLFHVSGWPERFVRAIVGHKPGTPEYAQVVADRIDHFIATEGRE